MQATPAEASHAPVSVDERLAAGPISWGACEVPGWGVQPTPDEVLDAMASLGLRGTEAGPAGFLPDDPDALAQSVMRYGLKLVGGFVPLVLHERNLGPAADQVRAAAARFAGAGAQMLVLAAVQDADWSRPRPLDDDGYRRLAEHVAEVRALAAESGVDVALHPHVGTLIETAEQIDRVLDAVDVGWCLDTGHLLIGGLDPVRFAREHGHRVVHVHLKDVNAALAAGVRDGSRSLLDATRAGLFQPLGHGDARIADVLDALAEHGYAGWFVLEQDTAIAAEEPAALDGPMRDAQVSIAFLHNTAHTTQEVHR
jgi:inosose dehydratase